MKVARLLFVCTSLCAMSMNLPVEGESLSEGDFQSQQLDAVAPEESVTALPELPVEQEPLAGQESAELSPIEEPIAIIEALESALETEPHDAVASSPESPVSEEGSSEVVVSELVESSTLEAEAVPAAEKSQGGKGHVKDPRINSDRPRVTHREAPEQKSQETSVVQEELTQESSPVAEEQAVGLEGTQQVIQVPEEAAHNQVVQEKADPQPQVQKKPQSVQPKAAQKVKPHAKPKSPSGTSTPRPLNRNSVYQESSVQDKSQAEEEADSKVLSFKGRPNRVILISREKKASLTPELPQIGVPLETKKGVRQREHAIASSRQATAHKKIQKKQPVAHQSSSSSRTAGLDKLGRSTQSHATVYQDTPVASN